MNRTHIYPIRWLHGVGKVQRPAHPRFTVQGPCGAIYWWCPEAEGRKSPGTKFAGKSRWKLDANRHVCDGNLCEAAVFHHFLLAFSTYIRNPLLLQFVVQCKAVLGSIVREIWHKCPSHFHFFYLCTDVYEGYPVESAPLFQICYGIQHFLTILLFSKYGRFFKFGTTTRNCVKKLGRIRYCGQCIRTNGSSVRSTHWAWFAFEA